MFDNEVETFIWRLPAARASCLLLYPWLTLVVPTALPPGAVTNPTRLYTSMVTPLIAVAAVMTMFAEVPDGFDTYQISELLFWAPLSAETAFIIEMPPIVTAVIEAVPALVLSSQLIETTETRFGLAPPIPCAVKVMVVPEEVEQALLTGVATDSANGSQPCGVAGAARRKKASKEARSFLLLNIGQHTL